MMDCPGHVELSKLRFVGSTATSSRTSRSDPRAVQAVGGTVFMSTTWPDMETLGAYDSGEPAEAILISFATNPTVLPFGCATSPIRP